MLRVLRRAGCRCSSSRWSCSGSSWWTGFRGVFGHTELTRPGAGLVNDPAPFNPKVVKYEIYGEPGAVATINYLDLDAQPQKAVNALAAVVADADDDSPGRQPEHRGAGRR